MLELGMWCVLFYKYNLGLYRKVLSSGGWFLIDSYKPRCVTDKGKKYCFRLNEGILLGGAGING